ncbi:lipoyl synthase, mitochondrial-like [Canna indica]|uniref:Lipoyl synthase, mitochondrial-like n=1 Tax=Canna indica TaxID=4628 RepID=A0AAQ3L5J5_9LILI|nr:lipoyl synthase, mitochondrial-like [Canna indica]
MQRPRLLLFGNLFARSVSGLHARRPLSSAGADPPPSQALPLQPSSPPTRTLADLRRRLAEESLALSDSYSVEIGTKKRPLPKPKWMKETIKAKPRDLKLHTVCEEARTSDVLSLSLSGVL